MFKIDHSWYQLFFSGILDQVILHFSNGFLAQDLLHKLWTSTGDLRTSSKIDSKSSTISPMWQVKKDCWVKIVHKCTNWIYLWELQDLLFTYLAPILAKLLHSLMNRSQHTVSSFMVRILLYIFWRISVNFYSSCKKEIVKNL